MTKSKCLINKLFRSKCNKKHDSIVQSALELFLNGSYESTSMEQIAQHAKVSKQTLYSHFGSKEGLFSAVMSNKCTKSRETSFESLTPEKCVHKEPKELIHNVVNDFYRMLIAPESLSLFRTLISESSRNEKLSETFLQAGPEKTLQILTEYFIHENKMNRLNIKNARQSAEFLIFSAKDYNHFKTLINPNHKINEAQIKAHVNFVVDTFMKIHAV